MISYAAWAMDSMCVQNTEHFVHHAMLIGKSK